VTDGPGGSKANPVAIEEDEHAIIDLTKPAEMIDLSQDDELVNKSKTASKDLQEIRANDPNATIAIQKTGQAGILPSTITDMENKSPDSLSTDFDDASPDTDSEAEDEYRVMYDDDVSDVEINDTMHSGTLGDSEVDGFDSEMDTMVEFNMGPSLDSNQSDVVGDKLKAQATWYEGDDIDIDPYDEVSELDQVAENEVAELKENRIKQDLIMQSHEKFEISVNEALDLQADIRSRQPEMEHFQEHHEYIAHRSAHEDGKETQKSQVDSLRADNRWHAAFARHEEYIAQRILNMSPPPPLAIDFEGGKAKKNEAESSIAKSDNDYDAVELDQDDNSEDDSDNLASPIYTPLSPRGQSEERSPAPLSAVGKHEAKRAKLLQSLFPEDYNHDAHRKLSVDLAAEPGKHILRATAMETPSRVSMFKAFSLEFLLM